MVHKIKWLGDRFQELHFGHIVIGKVAFIINIVILLKVFDAPLWIYIAGLFIVTFLMWFIGWYMERKGLRKHFMNAQFKDVNKIGA